jgi:hypothetical protein
MTIEFILATCPNCEGELRELLHLKFPTTGIVPLLGTGVFRVVFVLIQLKLDFIKAG